MTGRVTGRFSGQAQCPADYPAVGDWVAAGRNPHGDAAIHAVLPRTSAFARGAAGGGNRSEDSCRERVSKERSLCRIEAHHRYGCAL